MIEIEEVGAPATIQDLGRPGWFHSAVGPGGAADRGALRLANRLVGNPEGHAGIEVLLGGIVFRARRQLTVAVTGAPAPATVDGVAVGHASVLELGSGQKLRLGLSDTALRSYIGVRGGIDVEPVLGSCSRDTLSGIGPEPLSAGDIVPVGPAPVAFPVVDQAPQSDFPTQFDIRVRLGPRDDWFVAPDVLCRGVWAVGTDTDRVGARLERIDGQPLHRRVSAELPAEGMALGSIQVPPSGQPVVFLADHPITGGYPVVAVVLDADIDLMSQARPGQSIRFRCDEGPQ